MSRSLTADTVTVFGREMRPIINDPFSVVFTLVQPLVFLALFSPLLPDIPGEGSALQWFVPGLIVMSCLMSTSGIGGNLLLDISAGAHERMLVTPLHRPALVLGRSFKELVPNFAQTTIIVLVCLPFGFKLNLGGALIGMAILGVFAIGLGALSYTVALACRHSEWMFWAVQQTLLFPLLLLSGMLLPLDNGPGWLKTLSMLNPLTYVVNAERALFNGEIANTSVLGGAISAVLVAIAGLYIGVRAMQRAN
jgi:ABC-2 type transport system permease protein